MWKDPKTYNTLYRTDMFRDWTLAHLSNCVQYLDYSKENILTLEMEIQQKYEPKFLKGLRALEKETPSEKRLERGKRRGTRQVQEFGFEMQDKEDVPNQSQREIELALAMASLQKLQMTSTHIILTKLNDTTTDAQEFCFPQ